MRGQGIGEVSQPTPVTQFIPNPRQTDTPNTPLGKTPSEGLYSAQKAPPQKPGPNTENTPDLEIPVPTGVLSRGQQ